MVVFPQCKRVLDKVKDVVSPCVIEVISSVQFQIHPDEVEDDGEVMLIWDFNVDKINLSLTASQCSVKATIPPSINTIDSMPYLDPNIVNCNCSKSSKQGKILLSSCAANIPDLQRLSLNINEEEEEEENEEEQDVEDDLFDLDRVNSEAAELFAPENTICEVEEELFTESFTLKGSSYHEHFQNALKSCKQKMINKESVAVKLSFEPVNRRDENAILVHACPENTWKPIGYIPGVKVPKVTQAIKNKEISNMVINFIKYQYVFPIASFKYFATVTISKKGRWLKNRDTYKYNEDI
ncbi:hypothetical protein OS493_007822 [Desmophyllum pertusum]|uniref:Uncharacterized protein n=1 Tax=Desmophyllum pertusum TaxID=174260 RepID=A0A9X0CMB1_9CNID|nr:hypothetical protein OS493_007822 [Desmophyllum pertusum]